MSEFALGISFGLVCGLIVGILTCGPITNAVVDNSWRSQIAAHHAGEFYVDANGSTGWRWNDQKLSVAGKQP